MSLFISDVKHVSPVEEKKAQNRVMRLKQAVQDAKPGICTERAVIWTAYHKDGTNRRKPVCVQMAEALRNVLLQKTIAIYPDELIVGNFSSKRVGGSIFPELHGVPVLMDIFKFSKRKTNPLQVSGREIATLLKIVPFWMFRFLALKAYKNPLKKIALALHQLKGHFYVINESGGISHIAPDYETLITIGTEGIREKACRTQEKFKKSTAQWEFLEGVKIVCDALSAFGRRYARLAHDMAVSEPDADRKEELLTIAHVCERVPQKGASTLQEALQSIFLAQIAINLESLDNAVSPGRMDQYLYPFYKKDIEDGRLTHLEAKERIAAFSIKMAEIIPVFSDYLTRVHGGMFNGQVITVGGVDREGNDCVNPLTSIFLEVMDELRMRQPNYHARIASVSGTDYLKKINDTLALGSGSPALYNDDVIIDTMTSHGYSVADARDYTAVGCVEPVSQGKSFASTDAALFNMPVVLEMALNQGKKFGSVMRSGTRTKPASEMTSMADVKNAFEAQLAFQIKKMIGDLRAIETANMSHHPTPLTSMLLDGCVEKGVCSTKGGARYNFSGIQCVAPADTGDALYAIEKAVFTDRKMSLFDLVGHLQKNLEDPRMMVYLKGIPKFGNDMAEVDKWTVYVVEQFITQLSLFENTRGGKYVAGLYSVTVHDHFGRVTGALSHGRRKGESFSSGISPVNGMDKEGPTALINSVNRIDSRKIANGINFNLKFDAHTLKGETGKKALQSILNTYFKKGGMQVQVNVIDPAMLIAARDNPDLYPNLLVRVSGYSSYFNDLTPEMKEEIIRRSTICI
ncbi:MAG: formate acetyltransferase [Proteobacteria bacterium]|nr:formate acetyltransferase [Pseudomonadota bacterium]